MSELSDEFQALSLELITEFGQACDFERPLGGSFDPTSGDVTNGSPLTWEGVCVPQNYKKTEINLTNIQEKDVRLLVNVTDYEPKQGDKVTVGGVRYRVIDALKEVVNGEDVLYDLQVRI
jgi:hypothetical protein